MVSRRYSYEATSCLKLCEVCFYSGQISLKAQTAQNAEESENCHYYKKDGAENLTERVTGKCCGVIKFQNLSGPNMQMKHFFKSRIVVWSHTCVPREGAEFTGHFLFAYL